MGLGVYEMSYHLTLIVALVVVLGVVLSGVVTGLWMVVVAPPSAVRRTREAPAGRNRPGRHRGKCRMAGLAVAKPHVVAMTDTCTVITHLVTDEAMAAGRQAGRYAGLCGAVVLPGSLLEDTNRPCRACYYPAASR